MPRPKEQFSRSICRSPRALPEIISIFHFPYLCAPKNRCLISFGVYRAFFYPAPVPSTRSRPAAADASGSAGFHATGSPAVAIHHRETIRRLGEGAGRNQPHAGILRKRRGCSPGSAGPWLQRPGTSPAGPLHQFRQVRTGCPGTKPGEFALYCANSLWRAAAEVIRATGPGNHALPRGVIKS